MCPPGLQAQQASRPACHHEPDTKGTLVANNLSKTSPGICLFFYSSGGTCRPSISMPPAPFDIPVPSHVNIARALRGGVVFFHHTPCLVDIPTLQLSCPSLSPGGGLGPPKCQKCSFQGKGTTQEGGVKGIRADTTARQVTRPRPLSVPLSNLAAAYNRAEM